MLLGYILEAIGFELKNTFKTIFYRIIFFDIWLIGFTCIGFYKFYILG